MNLENKDLDFEEKRKRMIVYGAVFAILWAGTLQEAEVPIMQASELTK